MPGIYKEKECPSCYAVHRKRGLFCSQSCANESRIVTDDTKHKLRVKAYEYLQTPEGIANAKLLNAEHRVSIEDFAVSVPDISDYDNYDGFSRAEDW